MQPSNAATRHLPSWLGGGAEVSALAYAVVVESFQASQRGEPRPPEQLAEILGVDEADVLRVFAELQEKGVMERA